MWLVFGISILLLGMFALGSFVLLRGAKSAVNLSFAVLTFAMIAWILSNFLGANFKEYDISLYATRVDFMAGCILAFTAWMFSASLFAQADERRTHRAWYGSRMKISMLCASLAAAATTLIPSVVSIAKPANQELTITYGAYYFVFAAGLIVVVTGIAANFYFTRKLAKGRLRQQVSVMIYALLVAALFIGFVNLILPQISSSPNTNLAAGNLSYIGVAFFLFATFYSIVKHRLFDLRLVLARSVAYLLLIAVLTVAYGALTLLLSNTLIEDYELSGREFIVPLVSIVLLAFTLNPLGKFFNKLTNRIFYKDSYEPQQFLGDLNNVIIANVDLTVLLQSAASVMEQYLKTYFSVFDLHKVGRVHHRITQGASFDESQIRTVLDALDAQNSSVVVLDELSQDQDKLRGQLSKLNIAVAARLATPHGQELGYILLGNKKNGSMYTSQDLEMLNIATGELVIAIQNSLRFEEIERFNATLQDKVNEATRKLRSTNEKLRMLDQTKDDFISMASHQLRTPLTSVKGYVSMVLDGDAGKITPLQRKLLTQSFVSSQRMVYLISDLLNVSRLRTGKFVIEPVRTNIANVIKGEIEQLVETAKGRNLELTYNKPEHFPTYMLDETKLRQVIMNFIDNAIYYTPSGGKISVDLVEKPQTIEFTVTDNGMGVPKADQPHLFTKFFRAHNAKRARPDGTGLGLFMAKKVVIAQGGAVIFKSQEGKGSTFGFTFAKDKLKLAP
jgi:signal transduction histidine kinase